MKNTLQTIVFAVLAAFSPVQAGTTQPAAPQPVEQVSGLKGKVFAVSLFHEGGGESYGGGVSLETPITGNLYGELVGAYLEDDVYSVGGNLLYYVPTQSNLTPYALVGAGYEFESDEWNVGVGAGLNYTLNETTSLFVDGVYHFAVEDDSRDGDVTVRLGLGFKF